MIPDPEKETVDPDVKFVPESPHEMRVSPGRALLGDIEEKTGPAMWTT